MGHTGKVALKKSSTLLALGNVFTPPVPPTYVAEYQAVIDRATALGYALPSASQRALQNDLMVSWKASGAFAKADLLYVLSNDAGLDFGRINWKSPSTFLLTDTGPEPVRFLPNYGAYAACEVAAFGVLDTLWMPSQGVNFTLNSNCIISSTQSYYGASGIVYRSAATGDQCTFYNLDSIRVFLNNDAAVASGPSTQNNYSWMNRRTAAAVSHMAFNNAGVVALNVNSVVAAVTRNAAKLGVLGDMHNALSSLSTGVPIEALFVGGALTDAEFLNYDSALTTYNNKLHYVAGLYVTGNYTVPAGITQLFVECWGGGGSGRGYPNAVATSTGGGGGGGAYAASVVNVTPGQIIPFVIGAIGTPTTGSGLAGGDTSWNSGEILAKGGAGAPSSTTRAAGGLASASVGQIKFNGGDGGAGGAVLAASTGGGGSAAGALGDGNVGVDSGSASAVTRGLYKALGGGAPGYSLGNAANTAGSSAMLAAGGGGARRTAGTLTGGAGGQGFIRVSAPKVY